jgi:hypothetical protein
MSEFWNILRNEDDLPTREMSGEDFWRELTADNPHLDGLLSVGIKLDEDFYPYDRGRFDPGTGVPGICRPLAAISDDPDALYDRLAAVVSTWPRRPAMEHARAFFTEVAAMLGRRVIVERTGGALTFLPVLRTEFPEARYVFLYRDGADSALSMSRHPQYRLNTFQGLARVISTQEVADLPFSPAVKAVRLEDLGGLIDPPFDKERFLAYPISVAYFGWLWSAMIRKGTARMRAIPHDRWSIMRYESLLEEPRTELEKLTKFIGVPAQEQWLERACEFVNPGRAGSSKSRLHPGVIAELRSACLSGTRAFELLEAEHAEAVSSPS